MTRATIKLTARELARLAIELDGRPGRIVSSWSTSLLAIGTRTAMDIESCQRGERAEGFHGNEGMHIILTGFSQDMGFRVFAFECVGEDKVRTSYKVRADLLLVRKYGILMQELPLLCRRILERRQDGDQQQMYTFTEADMCIQADLRAKTAPQKRRSTHSEHRENEGAF